MVGTHLQAGQPVRGAQARRRAGGGQHRAPHRARGAGQAQGTGSRWSTAGAAASAAARWRWCWTRSASRCTLRRRRLQGLPRARCWPTCRQLAQRAVSTAWSAAPPARARRGCCRRWQRPARRCWTWKRLASHRSSVLGLIPGAAAAHAEALRHAGVGRSCAASIRRGRSTWKAKARRSATWPCPRR